MSKPILIAGILIVSLGITMPLSAQFSAISLTAASFNADVIADGTGSNPSTVTSTAFDGTANNILYSKQFQTSNAATITGGGLPNNGTITSGANTWQLQSFGSNNCLFFAAQSATSLKSLTLTTAGAYTAISLLATSGNGPCSISFTLHFSDGTNSTTYGPYSVLDWFGGTGYAINNLGRITRTATVSAPSGLTSSDPRLSNLNVTLNVSDQTKNLSRIDITDNSTNNSATVGIFAVSGTLSVLPLTLGSLQGQYDAGQKAVDLRWSSTHTTAGEVFNIQRSENNSGNYTTIGTINPAENNLTQTFTYTDPATGNNNGAYYYRIEDIQQNGSEIYSNTIAVNAATATTIHAWCTGNVLMLAGLNKGTYSWQILTTNGQNVLAGVINGATNGTTSAANQTNTIDISRLNTGIYLLHIQNKQHSRTVEFLKP